MMKPAFGCLGTKIKVLSGDYFDLLNPDPNAIRLSDMAGALSKICRFGGQCPRFYSVAEHLFVAIQVGISRGLTRTQLQHVGMHDGPEAYIGDMVKPLKQLIPQFEAIEAGIALRMEWRFHLRFKDHRDVVKEIDNGLLLAERDWLFGKDGVHWEGENEVQPVTGVRFGGWDPYLAERRLLQAWEEIGIREYPVSMEVRS